MRTPGGCCNDEDHEARKGGCAARADGLHPPSRRGVSFSRKPKVTDGPQRRKRCSAVR